MNKQKISLIIATILTAMFLMTSVSASNFTVSPTDLVIDQKDSVNFTIAPITGVTNLNLSFSSLTIDIEGTSYSFGISGKTNNVDSQELFTISPTLSIDYSELKFGKLYSGSLLVKDANNTKDNQTIKVSVQRTFCDYGNVGGKDIEIMDIKDQTSGRSSFEWQPLDEVSVRLRVKNNMDTKEKVNVVLSLYSVKDEMFVDIDGRNDEIEQTMRMSSGSTEYFYFEFKLPVEDLESNEDYLLFAKAFVDGEEDEICYSASKEVEIEFEDEFLIDRLQDMYRALCGETVEVSFRVYNLDAYDEEEIKVNLYNKELGINLYSEMYELDLEDFRTFVFDLDIPKNATEKTYKIDIAVGYDYRESTDVFRKKYDKQSFFLSVEGDCITSTTKGVEISAELLTKEKIFPGDEVRINVVLKNIGKEQTTYTLGLSGQEDWAFGILSPQTVTAAVGESKQIELVLKISEDVKEGEKLFSVNAFYSGNEEKKTMSLYISEKESFFKIPNVLKENLTFTLMVVVNLILLVVIIIVALGLRKR